MTVETFCRSVQLPVSAEEAFDWHERPGAIDRLIPPWESVSILQRSDGIRDGQQVVLANHLGPLSLRWVAEHRDYRRGSSFRDIQRQGPFRRWDHTHRFRDLGPGSSTLEDQVEYEMPAGFAGRLLGGRFVREKIERMFRYRHSTTSADLAAHHRFSHQRTLQVAISGSSGLIGKALMPFLTTGGHRVTRLLRQATDTPHIYWRSDQSPEELARQLEGVDAVIHLAGENVAARRWSAAQKRRLRESRVDRTRHLVAALTSMSRPPQVLISASAVGYYGDRGDAIVTEQAAAGAGFLAELAEQWEAAALEAETAGIRIVNARLGMVLSPRGGALSKLLRPFSLGLGGRVGSGRQWWSWISVDDAVGSLHHAMMDNSLHGPVNCVSPNAVTSQEFTQVLAGVLHRPALLPAPESVLRLALGQMADEILLTSIRVRPERLEATGYTFRHQTLTQALQHLLGRF